MTYRIFPRITQYTIHYSPVCHDSHRKVLGNKEEYVVCMCAQPRPTLYDPMDCSPPGPSVHAIFKQGYWSGLPFPTPGDLPDSGIEPVSFVSPASAGGFFATEPPGKPQGTRKEGDKVNDFERDEGNLLRPT